MTENDVCKHGKIPRNCYSCHLEKNPPQEKSEMDALHEKISELMVRVSKLEEYKRLQDDKNTENENYIKKLYDFHFNHESHRKRQIDENRAISKHFDQLISKISNGEVRLCELEESYQGLSAELRYILERLGPVFRGRTSGLTFEEAIAAFKSGKTIRFHDGMSESCLYKPQDGWSFGFSYNHMLGDHWEIVE